MNLRAREYRFFSDRVEFYEGFLNVNRKIVRYDRVTDISLNKSVWERIWGTGTILLNTAGSPFSEVKLSYIKNPEDIYEKIQNILKGYSPGSFSRTGTESYAAQP
ncbi:MAG TPA: PH domain-containing protein [Candidatus Aenigmarchaeota archaeon]|nr:MAG: hypothetical protein DRP03_02715 [Candidatus Aenigmarchaeota archaeon]HDD46472.1 PH domain-containing protein [Candidatus Aenigmarchaeota archaeon]